MQRSGPERQPTVGERLLQDVTQLALEKADTGRLQQWSSLLGDLHEQSALPEAVAQRARLERFSKLLTEQTQPTLSRLTAFLEDDPEQVAMLSALGLGLTPAALEALQPLFTTQPKEQLVAGLSRLWRLPDDELARRQTGWLTNCLQHCQPAD